MAIPSNQPPHIVHPPSRLLPPTTTGFANNNERPEERTKKKAAAQGEMRSSSWREEVRSIAVQSLSLLHLPSRSNCRHPHQPYPIICNWLRACDVEHPVTVEFLKWFLNSCQSTSSLLMCSRDYEMALWLPWDSKPIG